MITPLQLDSYQYKCRCCLKLHAGPTRVLDFKCVKEQKLERGTERIHEAVFQAVCECDEPINIIFRVREYPEGMFSYHGYQSADADIIVEPKVREHMEIVDG